MNLHLCCAAMFLTLSSTGSVLASPDSFVRISARDSRYFELTDGRPYIPIGLNMIAPPGEGMSTFTNWLQNLHTNGGNFIRVWLSNPFFDVEHVRSGDYDPLKAKRIHEMLAAAGSRGIRVKMCLEHFRHLGGGRQPWAAKPLHLVANGGTATNTADFFNGVASRERFKQKLSWFASEFGDRPDIFGWELWNEINAVEAGDFLAWTEVMLPELHRQFPKNLAMQSLGSYDSDWCRPHYRQLTVMPGNDVAQVHRYLDQGAKLDICKGPVDVLAADAVRELLAQNPQRPVLLAESGAVEPGHSGPSKLYERDTQGTLLHDVLFAPFFAGAAGPGHIWHWDQYVAKQNLWWHFGRFAEAVKNLDPPAESFRPRMLPHPRLRVYVLQGKQTTIVWCRDSLNTWQTELVGGKAPERITGMTLDLQALGLTTVKAQIYDPWSHYWSERPINGQIPLPEFSRSLILRVSTKL